MPACGDGLITPGETCDDHNTTPGDGCSTSCTIEPGYLCSGAPSVCTRCGNGIVDTGEACDDGNASSGDGCNTSCQFDIGCGPGLTQVALSSTTPVAIPHNNATGVLSPVTSTATGGVQKVVVYVSSLTHTWDGDLNLLLRAPTGFERSLALHRGNSGDNYLRTFFDDGAATGIASGTAPFSGRFRAEQSLSSLTFPGDFKGRRADGTWNLRVADTASIDTGTLNAWSLIMCVNPAGGFCGNGVTEEGEQCDDGNDIDTDACSNSCTVPETCGNGITTGIEECDDGNTVSGDGCSATCVDEAYVPEAEPNDVPSQADVAPLQFGDTGGFVRGSISTTTDVDLYRLTLTAPAVVRMETFTVRPNNCDATTSSLRILDAMGTEVTNDSAGPQNASGIGSCAALVMPLTAGTWYVRVEETGINATIPGYFLEVAVSADAGNETEPNDTAATANTNLTLISEAFCAGDHSVNTDVDVYAVVVPPGQALRAEVVEGDRTVETCESNGIDSVLTLFAADGTTVLVTDDDDGRGFCSAIDGTGNTPRDAAAKNTGATAVTWFLQVRAGIGGAGGQFSYKVNVTLR